jgi:NADH-quinone oxidoreductase subunit J
MSPVLFAAFGAVLVMASLAVVLQKSPVTSALFLVLAFCSLAGIYLVLQAEFIGMVQIIVYAGAIMVLFLFVIMYLNLKHDVETGAQILVRRAIGWLVGATLLVQGVLLVRRFMAIGPEALQKPLAGTGNAQALGQVLYSRYLFPFEITSILLLVAMVGAVVIGKGRASRTDEPPLAVAPAPAALAPPPEAPAHPTSEAPVTLGAEGTP